MEILFIPEGLSDDLMNKSFNDIQSKDLDYINDGLKAIAPEVNLREVNIGTGADWVFILAVLNGMDTLFLLGEKIENGIDSWIKIGKRIKNIARNSEKIYFDKKAANILAIEHLSNLHTIDSFKKISEEHIVLENLSSMLLDRKEDDFISKPRSLYILTFELNGDLIITLCVRSDGEIKEVYSFKNDNLPNF